MMERVDISQLPAFDPDSDALNIVIETPKGGKIKFKYDEQRKQFMYDKHLPYGHSFPFEFGFVPSTLGGDGDPLDVLLLTDEPTFVGCLVLGQLMGVIEAKQTENRKTERNDRLVAVPVNAKTLEPVWTQRMWGKELALEVVKFFRSYNMMQGKDFKLIGIGDSKRARKVILEGIERACEKRKNNGA